MQSAVHFCEIFLQTGFSLFFFTIPFMMHSFLGYFALCATSIVDQTASLLLNVLVDQWINLCSVSFSLLFTTTTTLLLSIFSLHLFFFQLNLDKQNVSETELERAKNRLAGFFSFIFLFFIPNMDISGHMFTILESRAGFNNDVNFQVFFFVLCSFSFSERGVRLQ